MANRMKEDEKNEKIIRGLLKLPANRRCINCNNLGPQYVCTNFWTFICTNCSGIHREFTHRVKSISMAKFTSQEVSALQDRGNERAREVYFKEWDSQRYSFPDSSNIDKLRDFIKHVYVDRRYTGERNMDKPPRVKGEREDFNENRREDSYRGGSRSPPYGDTYEWRYSERPGSTGRRDDRNASYSYGERSPGYDQGDYRRSPARFEAVDDRHRDDRFGNVNQNRSFEDHRLSDRTDKPEERSTDNRKDVGALSPPMVRPVREILGDDAPQLQVGDLPKPNGTKVHDNSSRAPRTASSSSMGSTEGTSVELKRVNSGSLIDLNIDSEPSGAAVTQQAVLQQSTPTASGGDWASFDVVSQQTVPQGTSNTNSVESVLSQLSAPISAPLVNNLPLPVTGADSSKTNFGAQWQTMQQQQPSLFPLVVGQNASPPLNTPLGGMLNNQSWGSSLTPSMQVPSQGTTIAQQETKSPTLLQASAVEAKPSGGRKELPEDIFTALYPSAPFSFPGWQGVPQYGVGYGMQYPPRVMQMMPTLPQSSKSANPFDLVHEPSINHSSSFPSMGSLQGALPNITGPSPILRSSSLGAPTTQWIPPQQPSFLPGVPSGQYMFQNVPSNVPLQAPNNMFATIHQGAGSFGRDGASFGTSGMDQHSAARYSQPGTPNSHTLGGNPFG